MTPVLRREGNSVTVGEPDPYKEMSESLGHFAMTAFYSERNVLRRLAWHLGTNGHADACEKIMQQVGERT